MRYGVPQNYKKAFELYKKSAENGNSSGECAVGDCYYYGAGVAQL